MAKKKGKNYLWHSLHGSKRVTHKLEVSGSILLPATKPRTKIPKSFFIYSYFYNKSNK